MKNPTQLPDLDKLGLDAEVVQSLRPRLTLTFGEFLMVSYTTLTSTGNSVRCSLEEGEENALKAALDALGLNVRQDPPVVECWLPLRNIRLSRGIAGGTAEDGLIDSQLVEDCAAKARIAAADVAPGWAGTRIWGDISEVAVDGDTLSKPVLGVPIQGSKVRVEVLEAFYHPEVEAERNGVLQACGLPAPTFLNVSGVGQVEAFATQAERQDGIAVLWLTASGAELGISLGGHIVALADLPAPPSDPTHQLLEASIWLQRNDWDKRRIPHGIRLIGNGLEKEWLEPLQAKIPFQVTLFDDPKVSASRIQDLFKNSLIYSGRTG